MQRLHTIIAVLAFACLVGGLQSASGQLIPDPFTHPHNPHLYLTCTGVDCADVPITIPGLFHSYRDTVLELPLLVVLTEFSDMTHRAAHTEAFWEDLVFGDPRAGTRPSVAEIFRENSNGRQLLVPAVAGDIHDGTADGVVGWVASTYTAEELFDASVKRAEGIRVADPFFDYWRYDRDNDGRITSDELLILIVFADNSATDPSCDQHHAEWGHPDPAGCVNRPGGNNRCTDPYRVPVDEDTDWPKHVHQWIAGVGEIAHVGVTAHELCHGAYGLEDLYVNSQNSQNCLTWTQTLDGYICDDNGTDVWYPPPPNTYSIMSSYLTDWIPHLDPWAKMHLGFTRYRWIDHDGDYTLYDTEAERNFSAQENEPELFLLYDTKRAQPFNEYFLLENRNGPSADSGLFLWLINERGGSLRRYVRLVRRSGHWAHDTVSAWCDDPTDPTNGYDITPTSHPRNINWTDSSWNYMRITDISAAGPAMTMHIQIVPIFVDPDYVGVESGTPSEPFNTIPEAVAEMPTPPRTIMAIGGNYPGAYVIDRGCTITSWNDSDVVIGR